MACAVGRWRNVGVAAPHPNIVISNCTVQLGMKMEPKLAPFSILSVSNELVLNQKSLCGSFAVGQNVHNIHSI